MRTRLSLMVRMLLVLAMAGGHAVGVQGEEAPGRERAGGRRPPLPKPDVVNAAYGPHERQVFDLWKADGAGARPLVIYYHGGGFRGGDKRSIHPLLLRKLLEAGVSVAAANYRLTDTDPYPAQMHDGARALQFIRAHASRYDMDPKRVGATGGSAGGGISLWLALHDDLADAENEDPVARQSSRLTCAVVYAAQSSYDPRTHREMFKTRHVEGALIKFFGMASDRDIGTPKFRVLFEEASPITHAGTNDPPILMYYPQRNQPVPPDSPGHVYIHHPMFGEILKQKLDAAGVECVVKRREDSAGPDIRGPIDDYVAFFLRHFGLKADEAAPDADRAQNRLKIP